ncbi:MAG: tRNA lysidine(34) synthetase TilS [Chloroflexi bacterium]|nr:tRNA lysidine(34) synthetase TilS [Chloroflexota bacterium]
MPKQSNAKVSGAPPRAILARVRRFIKERKLWDAGERVLVAVSGGPDSTCLILTLAALRRSLKFELHAAYFDHRLRGTRAAAREERAVRAIAEALHVPLTCGGGDVRAFAKSEHRSLEEAARELRYRFLAKTARAHGCAAVAVGHTQDDQAETVLLHIVRGSGLRGLAGMAPSARWPLAHRAAAPRLVRPLLPLSREETESCCREAGVRPLRDPANRSPAHLRNRIRRELRPLLRRYNPRIDEALSRLGEAAAADIELLERLAAEALVVQEAQRAGTVRLRRRLLAGQPEALQRHAVRLAVARLVGDTRGLSERHVRAVLRANTGPTGAELQLPRSIHAKVGRLWLTLSTSRQSDPPALPDGDVCLPVPGSARIGPWRITAARPRRRPRELRTSDATIVFLDADACGKPLLLRRRRPGDRFQPLGLARPKKLQDFFVDAHVPRAERDATPLALGKQGIAWIVGQRPAEWAKVTGRTRRIVRLTATRGRA